MSVRVLLLVLIVLLAANLGMEIWYRMDPPEVSQSEDALAPAPFLYDPQYYDDNAGVCPRRITTILGCRFLSIKNFRTAFLPMRTLRLRLISMTMPQRRPLRALSMAIRSNSRTARCCV